MAGFAKECRWLAKTNADRQDRERLIAFAGRLEADLRTTGMGVKRPRNLRGRHARELVGLWRETEPPEIVRALVRDMRAVHLWAGSKNRLPADADIGVPVDEADADEAGAWEGAEPESVAAAWVESERRNGTERADERAGPGAQPTPACGGSRKRRRTSA